MPEEGQSLKEESEEEGYKQEKHDRKMVKITLLKKDKKLDEISFIVKGTNSSYANAIRRSISEVPILAIDEVEFIKNDSALYDEIIAHRLGLIPLRTDKSFTLSKECSCGGKGCSRCSATFKLSVKGPSTVLSKDLKSKSIDIVYKEIPIVILEKGQELELIATARLGKAAVHAKFSPGFIWFRACPVIEIDRHKLCDECVSKLPENILDFEDRAHLAEVISKEKLCKACTDLLAKADKKEINILPSETDFIFTIESWGQLSAKEIFIEACKALESNLKKLTKEIKRIK